MSAHAQPRITPEQYLETERAAEFRNEYYAGRVYAISGGSLPHGLIITGFAACNLEGLGCHIALAEIYDKVTFDAQDADPPGHPG
jgi:hypothetical protein